MCCVPGRVRRRLTGVGVVAGSPAGISTARLACALLPFHGTGTRTRAAVRGAVVVVVAARHRVCPTLDRGTRAHTQYMRMYMGLAATGVLDLPVCLPRPALAHTQRLVQVARLAAAARERSPSPGRRGSPPPPPLFLAPFPMPSNGRARGRRLGPGCSGAEAEGKQTRRSAEPEPATGTMRCVTCGADKATGDFSNSQRKKNAGERKCSVCAKLRVAGTPTAAAASSGRGRGRGLGTGRGRGRGRGPGPASAALQPQPQSSAAVGLEGLRRRSDRVASNQALQTWVAGFASASMGEVSGPGALTHAPLPPPLPPPGAQTTILLSC